MEIVIYIAILFILYYFLQIALLIYGNFKVKIFKPGNFNPESKFSILIPFKDEEENLPFLLDSFSNLNYPKDLFELIFINDASSDKSLQIINSWRFKNPYIQLTVLDNVIVSKSPKKDAITRAQTIAKYSWILTTDADCIFPENILDTYNSLLLQNQEKAFFIGGVKISSKGGFLNAYQHHDMASLQAVTIGSFGIDESFMCNGANLLYKKDLFKEINGYAGVNHVSSGDDVFLLQKVLSKDPNLVMYAKHPDLIVETQPVKSWNGLFSQRARWAQKSKIYSSIYPKILGITVLLANLSLVLGIFILFVNPIFGVLIICSKFFVDYFILKKYNLLNKVDFSLFLLSEIAYPFVLFITIFYILSIKISWKNRIIN